MRRVIVSLSILLALGLGTLFYIKNYVGDLRPVILPPFSKKPVAIRSVTLGKPLDFELKTKDGYQIGLFAEGLGNVRDLAFTPDGVLLASITDQGKVVILPDRNNDGIADETDTIISGLHNPHGITFYGNFLYVVEETKLSRYLWSDSWLVGGVARLEKKLFDLPKGGRHYTRSIVFNQKGIMYISLGSSCDVCDESHPFLASVIKSDSDGKKPEVFAKGLRNSVFLTINPETQELWGTEMGRDFLGDNLPPDEINIIKKGGDYGWPVCYGDRIHDAKFDKKQYIMDPCAATEPPLYKIPAHSAPLGLQFINSIKFPEEWRGDLLVAYHGSWNRSSAIGYKVVRLDIEGERVLKEEDFISGFLQNGSSSGRPVDLEFDKDGNLYISDDKSGNIYIVSKK